MCNLISRLAFIATIGLAMPWAAQAKETVTLAGFTWPGAIAIQHVIDYVLETKLGYDVDVVGVDQAAAMAAMDKGDGGIDVHVDLWMPNHQEKWDAYIAEGSRESILVNDKPYIGIQGMFIPGYVQDKHGIKSVSDLNDPDVAKLFDEDGDGKGEWWPGPAGWGSTNIGLVKAKSYGFDRYFKEVVVSEAAFKAKMEADYAKGRPVLFFYWTPEWFFAKYDLRQIEEPPFDGYAMETMKGTPSYKADGCWDMYQPKEAEDWLEKSTVTCAFPDAKIYVAYAKTLAERAPKAARFLKQVAFDNATVSGWILEAQVEGRDPAVIAKEWVESHPDIVAEWLRGIE